MKKSKLLQKYCAHNTTFYIIKLLSFNIFFLYKIFMHILIWFIKHTRMVYTHGHQHICNALLKREDKERRTETAGGKKIKKKKKKNRWGRACSDIQATCRVPQASDMGVVTIY